MAEFVPFDPVLHTEEFRQLDTEYHIWCGENYSFDIFEQRGFTLNEYVNLRLGILSSLNPPDGIFYMIYVEGEAVGMGGLRRLSGDVARIMWMYIRPNYRGRGYGKQMLNKLLEDGSRFGYARFQLRPPIFGHAALGLFRTSGFREINDSESMMPPLSPRDKPYWIDMEKKE